MKMADNFPEIPKSDLNMKTNLVIKRLSGFVITKYDDLSIARRSISCHWQMAIFFSTGPIIVNNFIFPRMFYFICWCLVFQRNRTKREAVAITKLCWSVGKSRTKIKLRKQERQTFLLHNVLTSSFSLFSGNRQLPTVKEKIPSWEKQFSGWKASKLMVGAAGRGNLLHPKM